MDSEGIVVEQEEQLWSIDIGWLEQNRRSFFALAHRCLCSDCKKRFRNDWGKVSAEELLARIRDCCSGAPGFISGATPILESAFRLFLANGNQALDLIDLGRQLSDWRGVDTYRTSVDVLSRLLERDQHYGIRPVQD